MELQESQYHCDLCKVDNEIGILKSPALIDLHYRLQRNPLGQKGIKLLQVIESILLFRWAKVVFPSSTGGNTVVKMLLLNK